MAVNQKQRFIKRIKAPQSRLVREKLQVPSRHTTPTTYNTVNYQIKYHGNVMYIINRLNDLKNTW